MCTTADIPKYKETHLDDCNITAMVLCVVTCLHTVVVTNDDRA